ncbi:MAG: hypothetical protein WBE86_10745 [Candidatus Acidiferrales bacterium]
MRRGIWLAAILVTFAMPRLSAAQQASQSVPTSQSSSDKQTTSQSKTQTQVASQTTATKSDSLADAARKAREAQKNAPKAPLVFTNDNIPTSPSGVSVVGERAASSSDQSASSDAQAGAAAGKNDEETWRKRFADARQKIDQDTAELSVMQREMGELNVQYYPDPTKALMQSVTRADLIKKQNAIDAKQKELDADKQALSNLEDELRKAGGDPGWARE